MPEGENHRVFEQNWRGVVVARLSLVASRLRAPTATKFAAAASNKGKDRGGAAQGLSGLGAASAAAAATAQSKGVMSTACDAFDLPHQGTHPSWRDDFVDGG